MKFINESVLQFERSEYVKDPFKTLSQYNISKDEIIDCSLGTNPLGCSDNIKMNEHEIKNISCYPHPFAKDLLEKLKIYWEGYYNLDKSIFCAGQGTMGVIEKINKMVLSKGKKVLGIAPQFNEYWNEVKIFGATYHYKNLDLNERFNFSIDSFLKMIKENHYDVIFIDNPNNPTGQIIPLLQIEKIVNKTDNSKTLVIIDEAYGDYMDKDNSAINLTGKYQNIIVVRSFSKGFGLPGARIGYGVMNQKLESYFDKVNTPFSFGKIDLQLAIKALDHPSHMDHTCRIIESKKEKLINHLKDKYTISVSSLKTPIILLGVKNDNFELYEELLKYGVISVPGNSFFGINNNFVRVRIPLEIDELIRRLKNI